MEHPVLKARSRLLRHHRPYWGQTGATPTPQVPWRNRRILLLQLIAKKGDEGVCVNRKYCFNTTDRSGQAKDLRRLITQGLAELTNEKYGTPRSRYRYVRLTEVGKKLLAGLALKAEVRVPYAKRTAGLADFQQRNPKR